MALPRQWCSNSPRFILEVLKYLRPSTDPEDGFWASKASSFLLASATRDKAVRDQRDVWETPAPFLALINTTGLRCPVALGPWPADPSPDGCSNGAVGESRAERTSSGNQKPSQTAWGHLYGPPAICIINQLGPCSLQCWNWECSSPALQEKLQLLHFLTQVWETPSSPKERKCSCTLGNLLRGLESHMIPLTRNMHTKGKEDTWLPHPSHQHGKLDCSTSLGRLIPKPPAQNPVRTPGISAQYTEPCGSPSRHQLSSKPRTYRTPCSCHSPGVAFGSCPQTGASDFPAAKPTDARYHLQCLKRRTCSLSLGTSTTSSNHQNKAKTPGRNAL